MSRITWEPHRHGSGSEGFVQIGATKIRIATVTWSTYLEDPDRPWSMRTYIPGWTNHRNYPELTDAQASAERILTSLVTAMRPDAPDAAEVRMAAENAHASSGYPNNEFGSFLHGFICAVNWLNGGRG